MSPTNATYFGFIPGYVLFWGVFVFALVVFFNRSSQLVRYMFLGQKEGGFRNWPKRLAGTAGYVLSQLCNLKNLTRHDRSSLGHALMVWGFFVSVVFYLFFIVLMEGLGLMGLQETQAYFYFTWIMDFMAVAIFLGAVWGLIRRYFIRPARLQGEQTWEAFIILISVLTHPVTHVFEIGTKIMLGEPPAALGHTLLPPVSSWIGSFFAGNVNLEGWHFSFFWAHWFTVVLVLLIIPYTRYLHVIASIFNGVLQSQLPKSALKPIDLEKAETFGAAKITNLTWKQNLDLYSCVACGNCQMECPAFTSGKPLNPKKVIQDLKKHLLAVGPELLAAKARGENLMEVTNPNVTLAGNIIKEDEIWACTTCRACDEVCPVWVDHIDKIVDLRRNLVLEQASIPETAEGALRSIESRGHPWRGTTLTRTDWAQGLDIKTLSENADVDILFWVGCTEALEEKSMKVAIAMGKILKASGIKFGILGSEESCCGDPARRLGNEYLFQTQAQQNIEILKNYNVKKIVTACPHCYNSLKNEYPQFGGNFEVTHQTELIASLIKEGKIKINKGLNGLVTFHDSCYLGRYNNLYKEPREILKQMPGTKLVEMAKHHRKGFCCGGGGGKMWLEERTGTRISEMRVDQALATKAETVATACPYCLQMFDDAIKSKSAEEKIKVKDISEIVADAMIQ